MAGEILVTECPPVLNVITHQRYYMTFVQFGTPGSYLNINESSLTLESKLEDMQIYSVFTYRFISRAEEYLKIILISIKTLRQEILLCVERTVHF